MNTLLFRLLLLLWITSVFPQSKLTIAIQPFTSVDSLYLAEIEKGIKETFGKVTVVILPEIPLPESAYYKPRNRYRAEKLLTFLDSTNNSKYTKILGVTTKDISTTKGEYIDWGIFGFGAISGYPCVVSTYRLKSTPQNKKLLIERLVKVANHELGHTFGLNHCSTKGCLMEDAKGTIKTVDSSDGQFCSKCRKMVELILPMTK